MKTERKYLVFGELGNAVWKRIEKIKWSEKGTNEVVERVREKRLLLNNILGRKSNCTGHNLRRNCLLHDTIEGQMAEMKGIGEEHSSLMI